jgi:GT2 family glycosyltransferase
MADPRRFELDELVNRPGTYFNPQTEVLVVVDDSPELDQEIFNMEDYEGAEWVLIADDIPMEENRRDELLERFQVHYHPGVMAAGGNEYDEDDELEEDDQEVGRE